MSYQDGRRLAAGAIGADNPFVPRFLAAATIVAALLGAAVPASALADLTASNNYYTVNADTFGAFGAVTGSHHSAGSGVELTYGGFGGMSFVHSYTTGNEYPLAYDGAALSRIGGGVRQQIVISGSDSLLVQQDSVVLGTTERDSAVRFTLRIKNTGTAPVKLGARTSTDANLAGDDGPLPTPEGEQPLTERRRYFSPAFRTLRLEDNVGSAPTLRTTWTVAGKELGATPPDVLDVDSCCYGGYGPLLPPAAATNPFDLDNEVRWVWGGDLASARTVAPGQTVSFAVVGVLARAEAIPISTVAPAVTGAARERVTLSADRGSWNATALTRYAYQWLRCDAAGGACAPIPAAIGPKFVLRAADVGAAIRARVTADGGPSAESAATNPIAEGTLPHMGAPRSVFASPLGGAGASTAATPVKTLWAASDASGICDYKLERSVGAGAFAPVALAAPTTASITQSLTAGTTYTYRVTATDCAGNVSTPATGAMAIPALHDAQSGFGLAVAGSWAAQPETLAFGGGDHATTAAGARMSFTASARLLAVVARRAPGRGMANVYVDGAFVRTVDLSRTGVAAHRQVLFQQEWPAVGSHTLMLENVATAGRPQIEVDAFASLG